MGMLDEIRVHVPLPVGDSKTEWQTKSMECELAHYEIRQDGTLWHRPTLEEWKLSNEWQKVEYTGEIDFYSHVPSECTADNPTGWTQYSAYFTNGQIVSLNRLCNRWLSQPVELVVDGVVR